MDAHVNVAVFYHSETAQLLRLALAAADGASDAGGEVRVRRVGRPVSLARLSPRAESIPFLRDGERGPEAGPADLEWADVALFGTATPFGVQLDALTRFIDATVPLWLAGKLAAKVYGAFTAAAAVHGGPSRRLVSLTDVFHHWGGIVLPLGGRDPIGRRSGEPDGSSPVGARSAPFDAELTVARRQGRRATDAARALKAGRLLLADVA